MCSAARAMLDSIDIATLSTLWVPSHAGRMLSSSTGPWVGLSLRKYKAAYYMNVIFR